VSLSIEVFHQTLALAQVFRIARGARTTTEVIVVVVSEGSLSGWAEAVPYSRYGESIDSVRQLLLGMKGKIAGIGQHGLLSKLLPPGSARNALDCALWDLRAKIQGTTVNTLLDLPLINSCITAQTISIDTIETMQHEAKKLSQAPLIKVKLDADSVIPKMQLIHQTCPQSRFIVDANESWDITLLEQVAEPLKHCNVSLIEQPLPAEHDDELLNFNSPIAICADESCHSSQGLETLLGKYQAINIKLDKTGGLSEALALLKKARAMDFQIMIGCMVGSSLAMAPAYTLCGLADYVDLDGPLLVAEDRVSKFTFNQGLMSGLPPALWGMGHSVCEPEQLTRSQPK
jgi:L-alanine-DL-glutamate epimerase-like enolase superfamily enzyme